jgi:hypothetical protein
MQRRMMTGTHSPTRLLGAHLAQAATMTPTTIMAPPKQALHLLGVALLNDAGKSCLVCTALFL